MNALVCLALFGWIPLSIAAFATCRTRIATVLTAVGGWLFLPVARSHVQGPWQPERPHRPPAVQDRSRRAPAGALDGMHQPSRSLPRGPARGEHGDDQVGTPDELPELRVLDDGRNVQD